MNSLSWMIYFSEMFGKLSEISAVVSVLAILFAFIALVFKAAVYDMERTNINYKWVFVPFVVAIFCGIVHTVSPSRQTILLIASSEVGEKVLTSEKVQGIVDPSIDFVKMWLEKETEKMKSQLDKN